MKAYKAFYNDNGNLYDRWHIKSFEEAKKYEYNFEDQIGNGGGFYSCERPEDTLIYFGGNRLAGIDNPASYKRCEIVLAEVEIGDDYDKKVDYANFDDVYKDIYCSNTMIIERVLTREELIDMMHNLDDDSRKKRFISTFNLTQEEMDEFISHPKTSFNLQIYIAIEKIAMIRKEGRYGTSFYKELFDSKRSPGK